MDKPVPIRATEHCDITLVDNCLRAVVGPGLADEIQACYQDIVTECLRRNCSRLLIIGRSRYDPFFHLALRDALSAMAIAGLPAGFKLALVAGNAALIAIYDAVALEAQRRGIDAQRLTDEAKAKEWLRVA